MIKSRDKSSPMINPREKSHNLPMFYVKKRTVGPAISVAFVSMPTHSRLYCTSKLYAAHHVMCHSTYNGFTHDLLYTLTWQNNSHFGQSWFLCMRLAQQRNRKTWLDFEERMSGENQYYVFCFDTATKDRGFRHISELGGAGQPIQGLGSRSESTSATNSRLRQGTVGYTLR